MWMFDWIHKKRKKKRKFQIIRQSFKWTRLETFHLQIPKYQPAKLIQKTICERIVKTHEKQIKTIQTWKPQVFHYHIHKEIRIINQALSKNHRDTTRMDDIKQAVRRYQHQNFLEEQAYFRTRPTMAKTLFQKMAQGIQPSYYQKGKHVRPVHLEIIKRTLENTGDILPLNPKEAPAKKRELSTISHVYLVEIIREVLKGMRKEKTRKGYKIW